MEFVVESLGERGGLLCDECGEKSAVVSDYAVTRDGETSVGVLVSCEACGHVWP